MVQTALRHVLEPIWEAEFAETSYGFRPGRGCRNALRRVDELLKQGFTWVVDADLKKYFDTIPQDRLMEAVRQRIADGRVLDLIESYLQAGVMDGNEMQTSEQGTPQGAVISPLLANLYLNDLDHEAARQGLEMVRYADDFVILCRIAKLNEVLIGWFGYFKHSYKTRRPSDQSTVGCECGCAASYGNERARRVGVAEPIISAGRIDTLQSWGCSDWSKPML